MNEIPLALFGGIVFSLEVMALSPIPVNYIDFVILFLVAFTALMHCLQ